MQRASGLPNKRIRQFETQLLRAIYRSMFDWALTHFNDLTVAKPVAPEAPDFWRQSNAEWLKHYTAEQFVKQHQALHNDLEKFTDISLKNTLTSQISLKIFVSDELLTPHSLAMLGDLKINHESLFHFIASWISLFEHSSDIVTEAEHIEKALEKTPLNEYRELVHYLVCIHILENELDSQNKKCDKKVKEYLSVHRHNFLHGGFGKTKALEIYEAILSGNKNAEVDLLNKKQAFEVCYATKFPVKELVYGNALSI